MGAQGHEVCVERPDSLKPQSDIAGRTEVKEVRGQVISPRAAIDEGGVNLCGAGGRQQKVRWVRQPDSQSDRQTVKRQTDELSHLAMLQWVKPGVVGGADNLGVVAVGGWAQRGRHVVATQTL